MNILPTTHTGVQADGITKLKICGEIHETVTRDDFKLSLQAVVVGDLDCQILAGTTFMESNDIVPDLPRKRIIVKGNRFIPYCSQLYKPLPLQARKARSFLIKAPDKHTVFPGDFIEIKSPSVLQDNVMIAIEPRCDTGDSTWIKPVITKSIAGRIRIPNTSQEPVLVSNNQHLAQVHYTIVESEQPLDIQYDSDTPPLLSCSSTKSVTTHSECINLDPDNKLSKPEREAFIRLHSRYDNVFNAKIGKYNNASGSVQACINMGPVEPPVLKARLPSYNSEKMKLLQEKMDDWKNY